MTEYPYPDRSSMERNFKKTEENEELDIGWCKGMLSDGRPYFAECWAEWGFTVVTFFFSARGLEHCTDADLKDLLRNEGLVDYLRARPAVEGMLFEDPSGNEMWSANVVIGDETGLWARDHLKFHRYPVPEHPFTGTH